MTIIAQQPPAGLGSRISRFWEAGKQIPVGRHRVGKGTVPTFCWLEFQPWPCPGGLGDAPKDSQNPDLRGIGNPFWHTGRWRKFPRELHPALDPWNGAARDSGRWRGWNGMILKAPSKPIHSGIPCCWGRLGLRRRWMGFSSWTRSLLLGSIPQISMDREKGRV